MPPEPERLNVGLVFGGVSPEHEVSVISTLQAAAALDPDRYSPVPIYIAKDGAWLTGEDLLDIRRYQDLDDVRADAEEVIARRGDLGRVELASVRPAGWFARPLRRTVDVFFIGLHGGEGENGSLQGLFETLNVPYTGSGVLGSAVGMDKVVSKWICRDQDIPVVDFVAFRESEWAGREEAWLDRCEAELGYPVVVKPARLGSSIGIRRADDRAELDAAVEDGFRYDDKVIVEFGIDRLREINCSVLGDPDEAVASLLEEPVRTTGEALLTFAEKYQRGGDDDGAKTAPAKRSGGGSGMASMDRLIPAPLSPERTEVIRALGVRVFQAFECAGVARIDFMIDEATDRVYFNEINTIPGSFSFYLWEPAGVPFSSLLDRMIQIALARHRIKNSRVRSYDTNLLSERSLGGLKRAKG